jgi:hypothetical protein
MAATLLRSQWYSVVVKAPPVLRSAQADATAAKQSRRTVHTKNVCSDTCTAKYAHKREARPCAASFEVWRRDALAASLTRQHGWGELC